MRGIGFHRTGRAACVLFFMPPSYVFWRSVIRHVRFYCAATGSVPRRETTVCPSDTVNRATRPFRPARQYSSRGHEPASSDVRRDERFVARTTGETGAQAAWTDGKRCRFAATTRLPRRDVYSIARQAPPGRFLNRFRPGSLKTCSVLAPPSSRSIL